MPGGKALRLDRGGLERGVIMAGEKKATVKKVPAKKAKGAQKSVAKPAAKVAKKETKKVAKAVKKETVKKEEPKPNVKEKATAAENTREEKVKITADLLKAGETLLYPLITEKAVNMIDAENKLIFVVSKGSTREGVKNAVEQLYKVKVDKVNILKDNKARKRAFVKINKKFKAEEIATKLGGL